MSGAGKRAVILVVALVATGLTLGIVIHRVGGSSTDASEPAPAMAVVEQPLQVDAGPTPAKRSKRSKKAAKGKKPTKTAAEAPAARGRKVSVTILGAVIGPVDQNGEAWDGPGWSSQNVKRFTELAMKLYGVGAVPGIGQLAKKFGGSLAAALVDRFEPPDPKGAVLVVRHGEPSAVSELSTVQDSFTPEWSVSFQDVPLDDGSVQLVLRDADLAVDDPMTELTFGPRALQAASAASGAPYAIDTSELTNGIVLRVFLSVR